MFDDSAPYKELVILLTEKKEGLLRSELESKATLSVDGGYFSRGLQDLCDAGFIEQYSSSGRAAGEYYKLIDIDSSDDSISLCQIKYTQKPFVIYKAFTRRLVRVAKLFKQRV